MAKDSAEGWMLLVVYVVVVLGIFAIAIQLFPLIYDINVLEDSEHTTGTFEIDEEAIENTAENFEDFTDEALEGIQWQTLQAWFFTLALIAFTAFILFWVAGKVGSKMHSL